VVVPPGRGDRHHPAQPQDAVLISIGYGKIRPLQPEKLRTLVEEA